MKAMKKLTLCILALLMLTAAVFGLVACGEEETEECAHEWGEWETVTESTCIEAGREKRVCKLDETHVEERDAELKAHTFTDYVSNGDATCTEDGTKTAVCDTEGCDAEDIISDFGSKIPHTYDKKLAEDEYLMAEATCTTKAAYYYSCECGACGTRTFEVGEFKHSFAQSYVYDAEKHWHVCACGKKTEAEAHVFDEGKVTLAPTCDTVGNKAYTCVCGAVKNEVLPVVHTLVRTARKESTCTSAGVYEYWQCTDCSRYFADANAFKEVTYADTVMPVKAHDFINGIYVYDENGHKKLCANCDATTDAVSHKLEAMTDASQHWSGCECGYKTNVENHVFKIENNDTEHWFECGCGYVSNLHDHETTYYIEGTLVSPTCSTDGSAWYLCGVCGMTFEVDIPAEHVFTDGVLETHVAASEPTCDTYGNSEYWQCSGCGKYFSDAEAKNEIAIEDTVIAPTGHTYNIPKRDETKHWLACSKCDVADPTSIEYHSVVEGFDSTRHFSACQICGYTVEEANHIMVAYKSADKHYFECGCGYATDPTAHVWGEGEVTVPSSCTQDGVRTYTCECGLTKTEDIIAFHKDITYSAPVERTCEDGGRLEYWYCSECDTYFADEELTEEITEDSTYIEGGHDFVNGIWSLSPDGKSHSKKCVYCDTTTEWTEHVIEQYVITDTHHWIGCECGYLVEGEEYHEHDLYYYYVDGTVHEAYCLDCYYETGAVEHTLSYKNTDEYHWVECECGIASDAYPHAFEEGFNSSTHYLECECEYTIEKEEHTLVTKRTDTQHWQVCTGCDYETEKKDHSFTVNYNTTQHWHKCSCGFTTEKENHSLVLMTEGDYVYTECSCGYKTEKVKKEE